MAANDKTPGTDREQQDGGPGSHTEDETGGVTNDPASGGVATESDEESKAGDES